MDIVIKLLPSVGTVFLFGLILIVVKRLLDRSEAKLGDRQFRNQMIMILLTAVAALVVLLVIPVGDTMRGQLLSLIGILLSAAIALSSTTVLSNAMAGLMMRAVRNFRMGDFVRVEDHFGRVSERGLFHTEIQTEYRELTTLPNLYLVTHPVTKIRSSGTIVSTLVSLGYDVPRTRIEQLLLEAADKAGLKDPYVHVVELGDFSVSYRVAGMLTEVKRLLSARSSLRKRVLDSLHDAGIEIVSPNFMNTRALSADTVFVPKRPFRRTDPAPESSPEELVFDKAEDAASLENLRLALATLVEEIKVMGDRVEQAPEGTERDKIQRELTALQRRKERLTRLISEREAKPAED